MAANDIINTKVEAKKAKLRAKLIGIRDKMEERGASDPPTSTEKSFNAVLLTKNEIDNKEESAVSPDGASTLLDLNEVKTQNLSNEPEIDRVVEMRSLDLGAKHEQNVRTSVDAAINAPDEDSHASRMHVVTESIRKLDEFNQRKGRSTSLIDVMSDMTVPAVQKAGAWRTSVMKGFEDIYKVVDAKAVPVNRETAAMFIETSRMMERLFGDTDFPAPPSPLALASGDPFISYDKSVGGAAASRFLQGMANSDTIKFMAAHPYITSFVLDAAVMYTPILFKPAPMAVSATVKYLISRGIKGSALKQTKLLQAAANTSKKKLVESYLMGRGSADTMIGLGLGAVYIAGRINEDGTSGTAAFMTEVFGPMGAIAAMHMSKSAFLVYLKTMHQKNSTMFQKLNQKLAGRKDTLAKEIRLQMEQAVKESDFRAATAKTGKLKDVAKAVEATSLSPAAKAIALPTVIDETLAKNMTEMIDVAIKGSGKQADKIREIVGLGEFAPFVVSPRLKANVPVFLHAQDDIDELVRMVQSNPVAGAMYHKSAAHLDDAIGMWKKELETLEGMGKAFEPWRKGIADDITKAGKIADLYADAARGYDLQALRLNAPAFMQSEYGKQAFGNLPVFQGIGGRHLYQQLSQQVKGDAVEIQKKTFEFIQNNISPTADKVRRAITFGIDEGVWELTDQKFSRKIVEGMILTPDAHLRTNFAELVRVPARAQENQRVLAHQFGEAWRDINKQLSKKGRKQLMNVLAEGNAQGKEFVLTKGGFKSLDGNMIPVAADVRDAFYASRILFDAGYDVANQGAIMTAKARGLKLMDGKVLVRPRQAVLGEVDGNGTKVTQAMVDAKYEFIEVLDDELKVGMSFVSSADAAARVAKEIPETHDLVGYTANYAPIMYEGKWRVASIVKDDTGKFITKTEGIGDTPKQARDAISEFISREGPDSHKQFVAVRNNMQPAEIAGQIKGKRIPVAGKQGKEAIESEMRSFIKTTDADSWLQELGDDELAALAKALEVSGMGKGAVDDLVMTARQNSGPFYTRGRASERPVSLRNLDETAEMLSMDEAVPAYFDSISQYISLGAVREKLAAKFLNTYKQFLENPNDWSSKVMITRARDTGGYDQGAKAVEAWQAQQQLKIIRGMKSAEEVAIDAAVTAKRDDLIKGGHYRLAGFVDKFADAQGITAGIRGATAKAVFGLWNASHLVVQAAGMVNTTGRGVVHNPADLEKAMKSTMKYFYGRGAKKTGLPMDDETKFMVDFLDESGFINNVNYEALDDIAGHVTGAFTKFMDASTWAVRKGEAIQRAYAFMWNFHHNARLMKAGKHPLFKEADLTSVKFQDYIKNEAELTAFNMNKLNQPLYAKGAAGLSFQFMQIQSQMSQLFFGVGGAQKGITKLERMGIWATSVAAFGPTAIPFAETAMAFVDNLMTKDLRKDQLIIKQGDPENAGMVIYKMKHQVSNFIADSIKANGLGEGDEKYWRNLLRGVPAALTDGRFDIVDRATIQLLTNTYYDNLDAADMAGPGLNLLAQMILGTSTGVMDIVTAIQDDEFDAKTVLRAAKKSVGVLGGARNILSTIEALSLGEISTRTGRAIIEGMTLKEILNASVARRTEAMLDVAGLATGMTPPRVRETQEMSELLGRQDQAWTEWMNITTQAIKTHKREGNTAHAVTMLNESIRQVMEARPDRAKFWAKRLAMALNEQEGATIEDKNRMRAIKMNLEGKIEKPLF